MHKSREGERSIVSSSIASLCEGDSNAFKIIFGIAWVF